MPKRRLPASAQVTSMEERIEAFANAADAGPIPQSEPDPNAKRDFKALRVPFNEHEFNLLTEAAEATGRSKLSYIRWAIKEYAKTV